MGGGGRGLGGVFNVTKMMVSVLHKSKDMHKVEKLRQ